MLFEVVVVADLDLLKQAGLRVLEATAVEDDLLLAGVVGLKVDLDAKPFQRLVIMTGIVQINTQLIDLALSAAICVQQSIT